ncbi:unnamed protein product [Cladocopium goreaui]|uniref:Retrovirus-related Pol polyprotein from transposon RE2 (Retro element 2) (AtRE2) n=1 Tax=Cladocopium goreaui TaxID=2562237 RepID=A0A9P1FVD6_9DINO|nr:unnamed protein product [Cladocopium goreaui]
MDIRRRATQREMEQGMQEMQLAQKRMEEESKQRGEEAIEDGRIEERDEAASSLEDEAKKGEGVLVLSSATPDQPQGQPVSLRPAVPATPPPSQPPQSFSKSASASERPTPALTARQSEEKRAGEGGNQGLEGKERVQDPSVRGSANSSPNGLAATPQDVKKSEFEMAYTPLFTPEQVQQMTQLQQRTPWLYGITGTGFTPSIPRPGFLESEERRFNEELLERDRQLAMLQNRMVVEQSEREEIKRLLVSVLNENQKLKERILAVESQPAEPEARFATPDSISKDGSGQAERSFGIETTRLQGMNLEKVFGKEAARPPKEDGSVGHQVFSEAARPPKEDGSVGQQVFPEAARPPKEDGSVGQQGFQEAVRPPTIKSSNGDCGEAWKKGERFVDGPRGQQERSREEDFNSKTMEFMFLMMQSMRDLQQKISDGKNDEGAVMGVEVVRSGAPDLPDLMPWTSGTGPLELGDWMLLLNPIISDLTTSSQEWWEIMTQEVEAWYQRHVSLSPLDRLNHGFAAPASLQQPRWQRLERRVSTMIMKAIPESCCEELVAARRMDVFGVLTYLFTTYSPGGVAEKQTLLKSLEDPAEITSVQEAPGAIRKWMRWRRRAKEVGAVEPDPALLLKGLNKMTRRVLESHRDIQFRVSLVRNTLSVDTTPTSSSVDQLAAHLLAELEQCAMTDKRSITTTAKKEVELPKLKNMEAEAAEEGKGKGRDREKNDEEKSKQKCRYYLTEGGCRKGRECTWSHEQRDELRRCYVCGSSQHLAPSCTRPKSSSTSPEKSAPKAKQLKTEEEKVGGKKESEEAAASTQDSAMKDLIDEASKVLKSISGAPSSSASSASSGSAKDSEGKEDLMERLQQQLNSLRQKQKVLRLQKMATGDQAGLIDSGDLKVSQHNGCPQVSRQLALDLISELEDANQGLKRGLEMSDEFEWLQAMVKAHPVLSQLPDHIKERLAVQPGDWNGLPCNRRWRRAMQRDGLLLHLYAGEDSGFTFGKAWKQCGGEERILLEVDVKRGSQHDMIPDDGIYASLITAAIQGKILGIAGGPNCRSRSVLRHYEIPGCDTAPRPVRAWKGEEYGKKDLSEKEKKMVEEDDILLWRQIFLFMIATYARRARGHDHPLAFVLEQPSSPREYKPEVVSFWDQWEWHEIKKEFELKETHFTQKSLGGEATKPTTLGTSLDLVPEDFQIKGPVCPGGVRSSKDLARWPPGLMRMLAVAIKEQTMQSHARIAPMSWEDHIRFGHVPYRKDCKTCQETLQQQEPHRRARHLQTGTLSLDVAGPFTPAYDLGGHMARWFLTGVLVWRVPKDSDKMRQPPDEELQGEEPAIEEAREAGAEEKEEAEVQVEEGQGEQRDEERREDLEEKTEVRIFRLALPMLREKTTVRRLDASMEAQEEEETEKWKVKARIRRIIEEEMRAMVEDDEETAMDEMAVIGRLRKAVESMEDSEEILQTKIISPKEVWEHWEEWEVRWVICGNYEEKRDDEQTYSAGADATAFRLMLWFAARNQWLGMSLDIRTAFLNAVIDQEDQSNYILVAPPTIFVKKGCLRPGTLYRPKRAVYGLRRSPRLWGLCRDSEMRSFEVEVEKKEGGKIKLQLRQLDSEPNLWRLEEVGKEEGSEPSIQYGLVMTYVDDIFITGPPEVTRAVAQKFQATWTTSEPEVVGEEAIRFLGMEVSTSKNAEGRDVWHVTQESFVKDLVKRQAKEVQPKKIPITRDQALMTLDPSPPTLEKVRKCQKVVGELLWVLTRTRPDLMYSISRLGSNVTKATSSVLEAADQVQRYLLKTCAEGLRYQDDEKEPIKIQVFSDVSYAPNDEESFGCFIITLNRAPIFWRAGRQHLVTLSTAEAELAELVEAMTAGESVAAIVDELIGYVPRGAFTDSQSALAIITTDGGNWRTRHLRTRASYARQTVLSGRWVIHHSPGEFLTADIGTKPLSSKRLETLREMMMMGSPPKKEEIKQEEKDEEQKEKGETLAKAIKVSDDMIRLVTTIAILAVARGDSEDEEEEGGYQALQSMLAVFAIFMVLLTLFAQWLWKVGVQIARRQNLSPKATGSRPEVRGEKMGRRGGEDGLSSSSVQLPSVAVEKGLGFGSVRLRSLAVEKGLGSGERIENELQNIEAEVAEIRERLRITPPEDEPDAEGETKAALTK